MTTNTNIDLAAYSRLIDDLLWLHARGLSNDGLQEAVDAMIAEYTANPDHYSDGSPIVSNEESTLGSCFLRRIAALPRRIHRQGQQHSTGTSRSTLSPS